jgi:hypothetical protein
MLHGTVNFETPDHQTSQITAGQSQQITGSGGKYQMGDRKPMSPANSDAFFEHASHLLEHASGYGVVRRGLGPDVAKEMQRHGYKLPAETMGRMQNAGKTHYKTKPAFNRSKAPQSKSHPRSEQKSETKSEPKTESKSTTYHNTTRNSSEAEQHPKTQTEKPLHRTPAGGAGWRDKDKNPGE